MAMKTTQKIPIFTGMKQEQRTIWVLILILALAPLFPLSNFVGHPHWDQIRWIPFQGFTFSKNMLKDVVGNTLWFMVFGYLLHYQLNGTSRSRWSLATILAIASGVSLVNEIFQIFCHSRYPSMTDVVCNVFGAGLGGYCALKWPYDTCYETITNYFVRR